MPTHRTLIGAALLTLLGSANAQSNVETQLLARINEVRAQGYNCPTGRRAAQDPVAYKPVNSTAARVQALYMASTGRVTHTGADGSSPKVRAASYGVQSPSLSEIIYLNVDGPIERAVQWWLHSAVHCNVIMDGRYNFAGVSVVNGPRGKAHVMVFSSQ
ncbi:CAP domain-containing protein [Deinococcus peraridilitoris]|uniref:Uncharacterized protein with SCP/PR1 domains n=1 Tax=Deinococcus peraridilitoris (strain DSM 19664 / LMG 22246 / CIP 109416 / KR-200) TaxID=937777 RepID=L0A236_DEIPD|nr:CAP domain-containing protein [Deinococcus peraridilitoris]AFZ67509.1 uncharacterized protein with SCP/PR1 domains [Deinococcus peraridilitoris DSM 19664]